MRVYVLHSAFIILLLHPEFVIVPHVVLNRGRNCAVPKRDELPQLIGRDPTLEGWRRRRMRN